MGDQRMLRCRFCDWEVLPFRVAKNGKKRSGFGRLRHHIEEEHPAEFQRIYGDDQPDDFADLDDAMDDIAINA